MGILIQGDGWVHIRECPHKYNCAGWVVTADGIVTFYPTVEAFNTPPMTAQDMRDLADYMDRRGGAA